MNSDWMSASSALLPPLAIDPSWDTPDLIESAGENSDGVAEERLYAPVDNDVAAAGLDEYIPFTFGLTDWLKFLLYWWFGGTFLI